MNSSKKPELLEALQFYSCCNLKSINKYFKFINKALIYKTDLFATCFKKCKLQSLIFMENLNNTLFYLQKYQYNTV